jgi:hypothetical protein
LSMDKENPEPVGESSGVGEPAQEGNPAAPAVNVAKMGGAVEPEAKPADGGLLGGNVETLLKVGSVILGALYVLGLLVSNVQLMELGVADFSSLQVRNVMTGILFLGYVMLLVLALIPLAVAAYLCWRLLKWSGAEFPAKLLSLGGIAVTFVSLEVGAVSWVGSLLGFLFPWGRKWEDINPATRTYWTWGFMKRDMVRTMVQFQEAYGYRKIITAAVCLLLLPVMLSMFTLALRTLGGEGEADQRIVERMVARVKYGIAVPYTLLIVFLMLVGFADNVYPNVKYNLGGGQPQVAELQVQDEKGPVTVLPVIPMCCAASNASQSLETAPLAIWYQSDKFLYVSPLPDAGQGGVQMVALDLKIVRSIHYLPKYVRIGSGKTILSVGSY